eukprot:m.509022 g.509022  ORF g.509022 m.509022 type:complete len:373 (+) comp57394_c0_seq12:156-1274(+)
MPWPFSRKASSTTKGMSAGVLMSGWITRLSKNQWKRRYYVLRLDKSFSYFKSHLNLSSPKGSVMLSERSTVTEGKGNRFTVVVDASTTYSMYCDTADATERWISAIKAIAANQPEIFLSHLPTNSPVKASDPEIFSTPVQTRTHPQYPSSPLAPPSDSSPQAFLTERQLLDQVLKRTENRFCADCHTPAPTWASYNLGILICVNCAGVHRGLGVHISKVRSIHLDHWSMDQVKVLASLGNIENRRVLEVSLPANFIRPKQGIELKKFIHQKYIEKRFALASLYSEINEPTLQRTQSSAAEYLSRPTRTAKHITVDSSSLHTPAHTPASTPLPALGQELHFPLLTLSSVLGSVVLSLLLSFFHAICLSACHFR